MATYDSHDYSSGFTANHNAQPSQARSLLLRRYLAENASPSPHTHYDYAQESPAAVGDQSCGSTLEFRVPLLPAASSFSDFQSNAPALQPALYGAPWTHWYEAATGVGREKGVLDQAPVYATVSIPLPGPASAAAPGHASIPALRERTARLRAAKTTDDAYIAVSAAQLEDEVMKVESPALSLHDICHVESSASSLDSLALPPPTVAQNSPDLLAPRPLPLANDFAYSECPSTDYVTPTWTSASSVPSLVHGSSSWSESNALSASSSYKMSELLRSSPGPPLGPWLGERTFCSSPPPVGLYADVNMREMALRTKTPPICVNPADVMTDSLMFPSPTMDSSPTLECKPECPPTPVPALSTAGVGRATPTQHGSPSLAIPQAAVIGEDFPDEAISAIMSVLKPSAVKPEPQPAFVPGEAVCPAQTLKENVVIAPQPLYPQRGHIYPGNDLGMLRPGFGNPKAPGPSSQPHKRVPLADLPIPQPQYTGQPHAHLYGAYQHATPTYSFAPPPPLPQTRSAAAAAPASGPPLSPVLNAHAGITIEELRRRADDYRARHEGADLDKNFLQCFAGRLSARGEMLDEYRCYVTGCEQRNKRRDHILVHVGAHVEHRPWMCRHCGMRFLRKNECKRHEAGHGGRKPYSCSICAPYQEKSFVRQDLLKRHLRVAHGAQGAVPRKKRGNVKDEEEDYWP